MSETQQTTGDRIMRLIETRFPDKAAQIIAAEIDALTRERDEARAEVERLRPAAEAWEALETLRPMFNAPLPVSAEAERNHYAAIEAADQKYQAAAARAREAAKEGK